MAKKSSISDLRVEIHSFDKVENLIWKTFLRVHFISNCLSRHLVISEREEEEDNGWWWVQKWWHLKEIHIYVPYVHTLQQAKKRARKVMKAWKFPPLHFQQVNTIRACMSDFLIKFSETTAAVVLDLIKLKGVSFHWIIDTGCKSVVTSQQQQQQR